MTHRDISFVELDEQTELLDDLSGGPTAGVGVRLREVTMVHVDGDLESCVALFEIDPDGWRIVSDRELLHLERAARGPGSAQFAPRTQVTVEARLAPQHLIAVAGLKSKAAASRILGDPSLRGSSCWYALQVTEDVPLPQGVEGTLHSGFATTWAQSPGGPASQQGRVPPP